MGGPTARKIFSAPRCLTSYCAARLIVTPFWSGVVERGFADWRRIRGQDHFMAKNQHAVNGARAAGASWPAQIFLFARNFIKHPSMIGWMFPTSPWVVDEVLKQVDWQNARVIVEYGPGLGTFTHDILKRMHPEGRLVALETNEEFYRYLLSAISDPRFHLLHESATEVDSVLKRLGLPQADYIISGVLVQRELENGCLRVT